MLDRTTKLLLGAVAIGLWANLFAVLLKPTEAIAQAGAIAGQLGSMSANLAAIANGTCANRKICRH